MALELFIFKLFKPIMPYPKTNCLYDNLNLIYFIDSVSIDFNFLLFLGTGYFRNELPIIQLDHFGTFRNGHDI